MEPINERLSRIQTQWSKLFQPEQTLLRYHGAVFRYLLGAVRDPEAAEELSQEFAVRFLRGDFQNANPERGRYRDFLKTCLRHQTVDYWRKKNQQQAQETQLLPVEEPAVQQAEAAFTEGWREELLARAWEAMAKEQADNGSQFFTVLRFKVDHPQMRSSQIADSLAPRLGKKLSDTALRQMLHRARDRFAQFLLMEVKDSLSTSEQERLEEELIDLRLLDFCRPALVRKT